MSGSSLLRGNIMHAHLSCRATASCRAAFCLDTTHAGLQHPRGHHVARIPPHVGLQHPRGQHVARMPPGVMIQPLPGPPYHWIPPSQETSGMIMMPPPNMTYPYAIIAAFPPSAPFHPSVNTSAAPPPSTSSFGHRAYSTKKHTKG
ncbi:hypothetical protein BDR07DRAFT_1385823 [Suillus spraguei]|nr:hypothetical protein BDR07DRAFT_1385823 [Suillus spraguei]